MAGSKPSKPKTVVYKAEPPPAPPPTPPAPTETSMDVQQEAEAQKKRAALRAGRQSTVLTQQVNAAPASGATVLG